MNGLKVLHVVNISFVLPYYFGDQFDYFEEKGVKFHVACSPSEHLNTYAIKKKFQAFPVPIVRAISPFQDLISLVKLYRYIKKHQFDIIIGHTPKGGLLAMLASFLLGRKHRIYFRHGIMFETSTGLKRFMLKSLEKFTGYLATKVVCVSPSVLETSNRLGLSRPNKNIILNKGTCNGINTNKFIPGKNENAIQALTDQLHLKDHDVIGYVGRLVKDKGIVELIEGWKIVLQTQKNVKLLLVGPFEHTDPLPAEVIDFIRSESSVIYTGLVEDTSLYYQLMDLFILPSYREGFPTVVLEASAMELPIVTTLSTGCRDAIISHQTGLFTAITPEDIAEKISYYLNHKGLAHLHGINGRAFVLKNFKQEKIWTEIEKKLLSLH